jgi:capsular polysaccharide biosynthesis protein
LHGFDVYGAYGLCRDGNLFCSHEANIHPKHVMDLVTELGPPSFPRPRRFLTGKVAMITGPGHTVYGHWLSDFLPKLFLLHASGHDIRRMHYLLPSNTPRFGRAWMDLLGIPPENVILFDPVGEMIWVEELLLPTTFHNGVRASRLLFDAARFLVACVADHSGELIPSVANRRIFVSRSRSSQSRSLLNRERIEEIAVEAGLEIVYPESLPLLQQVRLFGEASLILGEYGSALHGSLFSLPGTTVGALRGSLGHPGFIQSGFGQALQQPTGYVFGETDEHTSDGRFTVAEQDFSDCLATLLRVREFEPS